MNPYETRMNQMNLMNLFEGLWSQKIFFCILGCLLAGIGCMQVHRTSVLAVLGSFFYIFFILVVTRMNQMYVDEPLCKFKRFFAFWRLTDEPLTYGDFHRGSFGSLRNGGTMNKKVLTVFLALLTWAIAGCGSPMAVQAAALGTPETRSTPEPTATITLTPTPTVDWQGTAIVAQTTADEARRLDTQATAQEKDRIQQQLGWTAQADMWTAQSDQLTATMALTSIPLTATQQAVVNTQVPIDQALMAGQLTATKEAPTQSKAMTDARIYEEHGETDFIIRMFVLGALGVFLLGIGLFAFSARPKVEATPRSAVLAQAVHEPDLIPLKPELVKSQASVKQNQNEVPVSIVKDHGGGNVAIENYSVPCSDQQLTELTCRVLDEGETLGVNNWEGDGTTLTRAVIYRLRNWFQAKQMVNSIGSGRLKFNEKGLALLQAWKEKQVLPHPYVFAPVIDPPLNMSHETGAHVSAHGGGA